jgi:hypothetical protein
MPLLRQPYTGPYDHERRRAWPAALAALTALLAARECPRKCVGLNERDVHAFNQREVFLPASEGL